MQIYTAFYNFVINFKLISTANNLINNYYYYHTASVPS